MSGDVVERICHKEQLGIWAGEIASILSLGEFLKDDWAFDDSVDLETELAAQLRDVVASALTHPEINVTDLITSQAAEIERLTKERDAAQTTRDAARENFLTMQGAAAQLLKRAETAERLLAEARAALEPFATYVTARDAVDPDYPDDYRVTSYAPTLREPGVGVTLGDFRTAALTLTNGGENGR